MRNHKHHKEEGEGGQAQERGEGGPRFRHHAHRPHDNGTTRDWWSWQESVKAFI